MIQRKTVQSQIYTGTLFQDTQNLSLAITGCQFHCEIHHVETRKKRILTDKRLKHGPAGCVYQPEVLELAEREN